MGRSETIFWHDSASPCEDKSDLLAAMEGPDLDPRERRPPSTPMRGRLPRGCLLRRGPPLRRRLVAPTLLRPAVPIVLRVVHDPQDVDDAHPVVHPADQPEAVIADIEDDAVADLVGMLARGQPDDNLLRLADGAAGNPLYLTELIAALDRGSSLTVT